MTRAQLVSRLDRIDWEISDLEDLHEWTPKQEQRREDLDAMRADLEYSHPDLLHDLDGFA